MMLYDYQLSLVEQVQQQLLDATMRGKPCRLLIVAGTGAGKTVIASNLIRQFLEQGHRILFIVDMEVLISQTGDKLAAVNIEPGYIKAGYSEDFQRPVQVASVQTLTARTSWRNLEFDIVFWDEAHTSTFTQIGQALIREKFRRSHHIGLTATPWRTLPTEGLHDLFDQQIIAPVPVELMRRGFLVPFRYFTLPTADLESVPLDREGDYNTDKLSIVCNKPHLINHLVQQWHRIAFEHRTIAFSVDVDHAEAIAQTFAAWNIPSAVLHGKTSTQERRRIYRQLYRKEKLVLASCGVLNKGFDLPEVSCVVMSRPTQSPSLYFQQLGRGGRTAKGKKECLLLDQAGNFSRFGALEDLTYDQLCMTNGRSPRRFGATAYKQCPVCHEQHHFAKTVCPCGYVFASEKREANRDLIEAFPRLRQQLNELKLNTQKLQNIGALKQ